MITDKMVFEWVDACKSYATLSGIKVGGNRYTRFEHRMILCMAASHLGKKTEEVMINELPNLVGLCIMAFRPLSSVSR